MNGLIVASVTAAAAATGALAYALRWAFNKKNIFATTQMILMFIVGSCIVVAFSVWIVKIAAALRTFGTNNLPVEIAALVIIIPGIAAVICTVFVAHSLQTKVTPGSMDQKAALALPIALMLVGGALGAVGDSISKGTSDAAVKVATAMVGGSGGSGSSGRQREASAGGR